MSLNGNRHGQLSDFGRLGGSREPSWALKLRFAVDNIIQLKNNMWAAVTKRALNYGLGVVVVLLCLAPRFANADECETLAAKIAKATGLKADKRTAADFISFDAEDNWDVAHLNCAGTDP